MANISTLTAAQQLAVTACRERFFAAATSTMTDRTKAGAAISVIVAPALTTYEIHWCTEIQQVASLSASLSDSLRASLRDNLSASLWNSLSASLWNSLRASLRASLSASLRASLSASLSASLWDSLSASLWNSLWDSLSASLWNSLRASLSASLSASLWDSLWNSLRDSGWIAFYLLPAELDLVAYAPELRARLDAFAAFAESAFALWVLPGHVIVLEKPTRVTVTDGKLVDIGWERAGE